MDTIRSADGRQTVGDDQCGTAYCQGIKSSLDLGFRHGVQGGGSFIQNQDGGILQKDPGNGHPLFLTAGQEGAPLAHIGVKALGHSQDILVNLRFLGGFDDFFLSGTGLAVADIFKNGVGKEEHILLHDADVLMQ